MRTIAIALGLAGGIGILCCHNASAAPAAGLAIKGAAPAAAAQPVQYREYRTRHFFVKCYRDLIVGPYHCHYYRLR
jgi:hypothetical protein